MDLSYGEYGTILRAGLERNIAAQGRSTVASMRII